MANIPYVAPSSNAESEDRTAAHRKKLLALYPDSAQAKIVAEDQYSSDPYAQGLLEESKPFVPGAGYEAETPYESTGQPVGDAGGYKPPAPAETKVAAPTTMDTGGATEGPTTTPTASKPEPFTPYKAPAQSAALLEEETVAGRIAKIMSPGSPLNKLAKTTATQTMVERGMPNSSLAAGEAMKELLKAATPIATADASAATARRTAILSGNIQQGLLAATGSYGQDLQGQTDTAAMDRLKATLASEESRAAAGIRSAKELQDDSQNFAQWSQDDQQAFGMDMQHDSQNFNNWDREDQQAYGAWLQGNSQEFQAWSQDDQQAFQSHMQTDAQNFAKWSQSDRQAYGLALQGDSQNFAKWQQKDQNAFAMHMQNDAQNFEEWKQDDQQAYGMSLQQDSQDFEEWRQADQHAFTKFMQDDINEFSRWSQNDQQAFATGMQDDAQAWNTWSDNERNDLQKWLKTESIDADIATQKRDIQGRVDLQKAISTEDAAALSKQIEANRDQWIADNEIRISLGDTQAATNLTNSLSSASAAMAQTFMTEINNINRDKNVATRDKDEAIQTATNAYYNGLDTIASVYGAEAILTASGAAGEEDEAGEPVSPYVAPDVPPTPPATVEPLGGVGTYQPGDDDGS